MRDELVQIFCKLPEPGRVKTRLAERIGDVEAAEVAENLATRIISKLSKQFIVEVWYTFEDTNGFLKQFPNIDLRQQVIGDLGERMAFALADGLKNAGKVVLVGSDCPVIDAAYVDQAFERLSDHGVVLGPAEDGGYGLIGVRDVVPPVFGDIAWSSASVLSDTCRRLNGNAIDYALLPLIWDVDRPADVERYYNLLEKELS